VYFFDSHAHVNSARYGGPAARRIRLHKAVEAGVCAILVPATQPVDAYAFYMHFQSMRPQFPGLELHVTTGIHPFTLENTDPSADDAALEVVKRELEQRPDVYCAVGECGLDFGRPIDRDRQIRVFEAQIALAAARRLPLVIHCVKAHHVVLELLSRHDVVPSVIHGWAASAEVGARYWTQGHLLGFGGALTLPNVRRALDAARAVPAEHMLIETDSPDQTPWARRPALNEPAFVRDVAQALAAARGATVEAIAEQTARNARRVFGVEASTA